MHDYEGFVKEELPQRAEPGYPPALRLANVLFTGEDERATAALAGRAADWLRRLLRAQKSAVTLVGPAPCPIERIKSRWRWHLLLKSRNSGQMTRVLRYFAEKYKVPEKDGLRVVIDRDPVALL
jgi:primosomal protein N' (replication factor Y)